MSMKAMVPSWPLWRDMQLLWFYHIAYLIVLIWLGRKRGHFFNVLKLLNSLREA